EKASQLEATNRRLAALLEVGKRLAAEHDPARLVDHVCTVARDILAGAAAAVGLLGPDGAWLRYFSTCGLPGPLAEAILRAGPRAGLLGALLDDRRPRRLRAPAGAADLLRLAAAGGDVRTLLAVPVASPGRVHGWLFVLNREAAEEFTAE